jgi:hypothetical protein
MEVLFFQSDRLSVRNAAGGAGITHCLHGSENKGAAFPLGPRTLAVAGESGTSYGEVTENRVVTPVGTAHCRGCRRRECGHEPAWKLNEELRLSSLFLKKVAENTGMNLVGN